MKRIVISVWAKAMVLAISTIAAWGQAVSKTASVPDTRPKSHTIFQFRGGIIFGGKVSQDGQKNDADASYSFVGGVEFPSRGAAASGFELELQHIGQGMQLYSVSVMIRPALKGESASTRLRPGLALGYGRSSGTPAYGGSGLFLVRAFLELDVVSRGRFGLSAEVGVVGDPFGELTNESKGSSLAIGLRPIVRVGLLFR